MTGTGTQTDPYIVDNWNDFQTYAIKSGVYVELSEDIDLNGTQFLPTINIRAHINGNNHTIKNFVVSDRTLFNVYTDVQNLNFVDFTVRCISEMARFAAFYSTYVNTYTMQECGYFEHCEFSGEVSGVVGSAYAALFEETKGGLDSLRVRRCGFKLKLVGGLSMHAGTQSVYSNCILDVDASNNGTSQYPFYNVTFRNCLIKGMYKSLNLVGGNSKYVVLDVDCPNVLGGNAAHFIVCNTEKAKINSSAIYSATPEQIKDADYLRKLGFPIGDSEMKIIKPTEFEYGEFHTWNGWKNQGQNAINSNWIPIERTAITVEDSGFLYCFKCQDSTGKFTDVAAYNAQKSPGITVAITNDWECDVKVCLANTGVFAAIPLPHTTCTIYNGYTWRIDSDINDGKPYPVLASFILPKPKPPVIVPKIKERNYITIYDKATKQDGFETHGLGILAPSRAEVTEELNGRWDLLLEHPIDSDNKFLYIQPYAIIKALGQLFTVRTVETNWVGHNGVVTAKADHMFYQQNDWWIYPGMTFIPSKNAAEIADRIYNITDRKIVDGQIYYDFSRDIPPDLIVSESFYQNWRNLSSGTTFSDFVIGSNGLLNGIYSGAFEGSAELYRDNFRFSINKRMENANDHAFEIRIGKNLRGIKRTFDTTRLCTYYKGTDNYGNEFEVSYGTGGFDYAPPHNIVRSGTYSYSFGDEVPEEERAGKAAEMLERDVQIFFHNNCTIKISYTVDLVDVQSNPDYEEFNAKADYRVGNSGIIYDERLGGTIKAKIVKTIKDAITGDTLSITFANN